MGLGPQCGRGTRTLSTTHHLFTMTIVPVNLKRATLTMGEKSVINHEFRIPIVSNIMVRPFNPHTDIGEVFLWWHMLLKLGY